MNLAGQVIEIAAPRGIKITCAESCTGGMVAAALTDPPGASAMFERGFVTYSNAAKMEMLDVLEETLEAHGAVSEPVVREMAMGAMIHAQADVSVAISGIAGPGGSEHKPEGRVCFALASAGGTWAETREFGALGRDAVRRAARDHALQMILDALRQ